MLIELIREKDASWTTVQWVCLLLSPIAGIVIARIALLFLNHQSEKVGSAENTDAQKTGPNPDQQ